MKARCWLVAAALFSLLPAAARAEGLAGRFMVAAQVGTQSEVSGNLMQSARGTLLDKPVGDRPVQLPGRVRARPAPAADARLRRRRAHRAHRARDLVRVALDGHRGGQAGRGEAALRVLRAQQLRGGRLRDRRTATTSSTQSRLKSYIAPIVGVRFLNEILVSFSVPEAGTSIRFIPFTQEGTVPVFGLDIGFTLRPRQPPSTSAWTPASATSRRPTQFDYLPGLRRPRRQRRALDRPGVGRDRDGSRLDEPPPGVWGRNAPPQNKEPPSSVVGPSSRAAWRTYVNGPTACF